MPVKNSFNFSLIIDLSFILNLEWYFFVVFFIYNIFDDLPNTSPGFCISRQRIHAVNILDCSIDRNRDLANVQPQQRVNSAHCQGMFKVTVKQCWRNTATKSTNSTTLYVITQIITVTKFKPSYQHPCGYNARQNVKLHYFVVVVLIAMLFQLLWEWSKCSILFF